MTEPDDDLGPPVTPLEEYGPAGRKPAPGLHFVSTPIGAARDITLRGLDILREAEVLAAEDTRTLRHLMDIHGIPLAGRPLVAYHDHNGEAVRPRLLAALAEGKAVAYASEAGTPLVADPGFQLGRAAIAAGHRVFAAPGPSAVLAALTVSGLPSDRFLFAGFPPNTAQARRKWIAEFAQVPATLVFYESPKRVKEMLTDLASELGADREAVLCRELTKRFEEVRRGTLADLVAGCADAPIKGEIVVLVDRSRAPRFGPEDVEAALRDRLQRLSVKDAAAEVAEMLGLPRREVYQRALAMEKD
ncbi:16S rRNA (cytidine(1402)-2'-O)-methyltransferase [Rhodobacter capsulatus]|uniref:Ribosomal RNA small subunit methyltransferase I n=1 Tax=Rhodobacter capsulatus (strain ATCC BAA-309 / NBRC 16581 / SB1003) TaxID=272942 RepID=D5AMU0_RHOCB|nr:16S rRNA (cytidine(1402)-2'-O)-methyltransferase [Rhodobacter capsulatus]ADE84229.1 tetrapyrrole methylase family protein [Rhodobacter capsulatus SB 1003]ETD02966.1 16S rRNA methyltransferase [Rhodobacter capsulatus DE442]ETD79597.1 16S rRNA methyltransferase [Rhodobacter capsulatus R121]ETD83615.1 16S rRNA methyltransferase [Rhodobacter capsulatus YW1]ETE55025.1 16S rRNA methyltransferase [Rhodobacter capsulatus Y262]